MGIPNDRAKCNRRNPVRTRIRRRSRIPVETKLLTLRIEEFEETANDEAMRLELDLIDEKRADPLTCLAAQKRKVERYYNSKVKLRKFADGSLVLRKVFQNTKVQGVGVLGPT